jgi:hypothetical protein
MTLASWEQLAMMALLLPSEGAQATSRTQSEWPSNLASSVHLQIRSVTDYEYCSLLKYV